MHFILQILFFKYLGEVDVYDCAEAAKALIAVGKADPNRIAIEGDHPK